MRVKVINNAEPHFIHPEMMERGKVYKVYNGDSSDLYCMLDNYDGDHLILIDAALSGLCYSRPFNYLIEEDLKLEETDLQLSITLAPRHYTVKVECETGDI